MHVDVAHAGRSALRRQRDPRIRDERDDSRRSPRDPVFAAAAIDRFGLAQRDGSRRCLRGIRMQVESVHGFRSERTRSARSLVSTIYAYRSITERRRRRYALVLCLCRALSLSRTTITLPIILLLTDYGR